MQLDDLLGHLDELLGYWDFSDSTSDVRSERVQGTLTSSDINVEGDPVSTRKNTQFARLGRSEETDDIQKYWSRIASPKGAVELFLSLLLRGFL